MSGLSLRLFVSSMVMFCFVLPASAAEPLIEVLEAGEGTKQELRMSPKVGAVESFQILLDMNMGMDMGGGGRTTDVPPVKMVLRATVDDIDAAGDIHYSFKLTDSRLLPSNSKIDVSAEKQKELDALAAKVRPELKKLIGTSGDVVLSNRGFTLSSTVKAPDGVEGKQFGNLQLALNRSTVAFPVEPIGVGARWTVKNEVRESGMTLQETVTYTLTAMEKGKVEVALVMEQKANDNALKMTNLPEGTTAHLVALESKGRGTSSLDLNKLFPTDAELKHGLESRVLVGQNGQGMHVGMTMQLDLGMKRL